MVEELTICDLLETAEKKYGERDAVCFTDADGKECHISFRALREDADALSASLLFIGLRNGHIALFGENSYEWLLAFCAIIKSGSIAVATDKKLNSDEALRLFRETDCTAVICSDAYEDMAIVFEASGFPVIRMGALPRMIADGKKLLSAGDDRKPMPTDHWLKADAPAVICFTSGTTGKMKGVVLTQRNLIADAVNSYLRSKNLFDSINNSVLLLPLSHTFSMSTALLHFFGGGCLYIIRNLRNLWQVFQKAQPKVLYSVPMLMEDLLLQAQKQGKGREAFGGRLEKVFCGGASVSRKCVEEYHKLGIEIMPGYGITECSAIVSFCNSPDRPEHCVGRPLPCIEIKIAEDGEILLRGETVFSGYYKDPEETAAAFRGGWFLTGDVGYTDDEGRLYITGRKKNLIILSNGENVAAEELEQKIADFPYVKEVLVYEENNTIVAEIYPNLFTADLESRFSANIRQLNRSLPVYKNIGKTVVRRTEFPKAGPMKIRRKRNPI